MGKVTYMYMYISTVHLLQFEELKPSKAVRRPAPRAAKAKGRGRAAAAWGSDSEGDENAGGEDSDDDEDGDGGSGGKKRASRRAPSPARKSQRKRVKVCWRQGRRNAAWPGLKRAVVSCPF